MNIEYLSTLPEVANKYKVNLQDDEKVVFTAKLSTFGTETERLLGNDSAFTLTNKRIIANNGVGIWTVDILADIVSCTKKEKKDWIFKFVYFAVNLNTEIVFNNGKEKLTGFVFQFNKKDTARLEEIVNNVFN